MLCICEEKVHSVRSTLMTRTAVGDYVSTNMMTFTVNTAGAVRHTAPLHAQARLDAGELVAGSKELLQGGRGQGRQRRERAQLIVRQLQALQLHKVAQLWNLSGDTRSSAFSAHCGARAPADEHSQDEADSKSAAKRQTVPLPGGNHSECHRQENSI